MIVSSYATALLHFYCFKFAYMVNNFVHHFFAYSNVDHLFPVVFFYFHFNCKFFHNCAHLFSALLLDKIINYIIKFNGIKNLTLFGEYYKLNWQSI